ncbi:unnamed protein product, partial [Polarella glacialis]
MPVNRAPFNKAFPWDTEQVGADLSYYMDIYDEDMDFAKSMEHLIWPLSNVSIRNKSFPAPREKELYIEARYGPGWKTPDHQSRELEKMYPSLAEGKTWSENTLLLQSARADAMTGLRMLERATVDYKTGNLMLRSSHSQDVPPEPAKRLSVQGLASDESGRVLGGTAVISPPDEHESDISLYSLYWAMEQMQYSDLSMKRLDAAPVTEQIATTTAPNRDTELVEGSQAHYNVGLSSPPVAASKEKGGEPRPVAKVKRCGAGTGDPFQDCAKRGQPLQVLHSVPLPLDLQVPSDATHLIVVASNEAGEGRDVTTAELSEGSSEARTFSRRVQLGLMAGLLGSSGPNLAGCISQLFAKGGKPAMLLRSGIDDVVKLMIQKKESGMKAALKSLADWLQPIVTSLEACKLVGADQAKEKLERALPHLRTGVLAYEPGKVLSVDGETIFMPINYAIGHLRKDKPASFGRDCSTQACECHGGCHWCRACSRIRGSQRRRDAAALVLLQASQESAESILPLKWAKLMTSDSDGTFNQKVFASLGFFLEQDGHVIACTWSCLAAVGRSRENSLWKPVSGSLRNGMKAKPATLSVVHFASSWRWLMRLSRYECSASLWNAFFADVTLPVQSRGAIQNVLSDNPQSFEPCDVSAQTSSETMKLSVLKQGLGLMRPQRFEGLGLMRQKPDFQETVARPQPCVRLQGGGRETVVWVPHCEQSAFGIGREWLYLREGGGPATPQNLCELRLNRKKCRQSTQIHNAIGNWGMCQLAYASIEQPSDPRSSGPLANFAYGRGLERPRRGTWDEGPGPGSLAWKLGRQWLYAVVLTMEGLPGEAPSPKGPRETRTWDQGDPSNLPVMQSEICSTPAQFAGLQQQMSQAQAAAVAQAAQAASQGAWGQPWGPPAAWAQQ